LRLCKISTNGGFIGGTLEDSSRRHKLFQSSGSLDLATKPKYPSTIAEFFKSWF